MITGEELALIKARAEQATAGKLYVRSALAVSGAYDVRVEHSKTRRCKVDNLFALTGTLEDAQFIAHAREDVPRLVAEVERLQSDNEQYYAKIKRLKSSLISAMSLVDECPECVKAFLSDIYEEEYE